MKLIKKILFPLFLMLAVVGGAVAADFMRSQGDTTSGHEAGKSDKVKHEKKASKDKKDSHGKSKDDGHSKPKKEKKDKKSKGHGKSDGKDASHGGDTVSYLKFKRQFVVPVMDKNKIEALVIMNLNIELDKHAPSNVYNMEPKLRDAIMRELLALSSDDIFGENLTSAESYQTLRSTLLRASKSVVREGVKDILILDIARQDQ